MTDLRNEKMGQEADLSRGTRGSAMVGKLLLPAYADSGSCTTFRPISEEQEADALTEVCDNRSSQKAKIAFSRDSRNSRNSSQGNEKWSGDTNENPATTLAADGRSHPPGFFPSTNPSNRGINQAPLPQQLHEEQNRRQRRRLN